MQLCMVLSLSCHLHSQWIIVWTPYVAAFSFALKLLLLALAELTTDFAFCLRKIEPQRSHHRNVTVSALTMAQASPQPSSR
jgi:hypothetical protein